MLIILPSGLTDLHFHSTFEQTQLLNGFDFGEFVILLKLSLHLLVVLKGKEVFQNTEIFSLIMIHQVFKEESEVPLLFLNNFRICL
jgi:hypothetical protein